jgi:hypothetical protein
MWAKDSQLAASFEAPDTGSYSHLCRISVSTAPMTGFCPASYGFRHAVPLNEVHIAALSHSALALDIYAWLAQRLHRIPPGKPQRVSWEALQDQFGPGYKRTRKFREVFRIALKKVLALYNRRGSRKIAPVRLSSSPKVCGVRNHWKV